MTIILIIDIIKIYKKLLILADKTTIVSIIVRAIITQLIHNFGWKYKVKL